MKKILLAPIMVLSLSFYSDAQTTQTVNLSTGTSTPGSPDPIWTNVVDVTNGTSSTSYSANGDLETTPGFFTSGIWATNTCANWTSPNVLLTGPHTGASTSSNASDVIGFFNPYLFEMTFNTNNACEIQSAIVTFNTVGADNFITSFNINGHSYPNPIGPASGIGTYNPLLSGITLTLNPADLILCGTNTVQIEVTDDGGFLGLFLCADLTIIYANTPVAPAISGTSFHTCCNGPQTYFAPPAPFGVTYTWSVTESNGSSYPFTPIGSSQIEVDWCSIAPGNSATICLIASSGPGCPGMSCSDTSCITIDTCCRVLFNPLPDITMCTKSVNLLPFITPGGPLGTITFSGTGVLGSTFSPGFTPGPGTYFITVTYTSPSGCVATATQSITVSDNLWEITSFNSTVGDRGNDIVEDKFGGIYVTGTFSGVTNFYAPNTLCPDITLTSVGLNSQTAYVAKFNKCGELVWVNYEVGSGFTNATSLAIDQTRNVVYITGPGKSLVNFLSTAAAPCQTAVASGTATSIAHYYVAKFDAATGAWIDTYNGVLPPSPVPTIKKEVHIAVNNVSSTLTDIYLTGTYSTIPGDVIFVQHFQNSGSTYSVSPGDWFTTSMIGPASPTLISHDIVYNGSATKKVVFITGQYKNTLIFPGHTVSAFGVVGDGFIGAFNPLNGTCAALRNFGITGAIHEASGIAITVDNTTGSTFFAGYFTKRTSNAYGIVPTAFPFIPLPGHFKRGYVIKVDAANNYAGHQEYIAANPNPILGQDDLEITGITTSGTNVFIAGNTKQVAYSPTFTSNPAFTSNGLDKMFAASINIVPSSPNLAANWISYGQGSTPGSEHATTRIVADGSHTYTTGSYIDQFSYSNGTPVSGTLISSFTGKRNTFIMRNDASGTGDFRTFEIPMEEPGELSAPLTDDNGMKVFPNPTSGTLNIISEINKIENIKVFDAIGQQIKTIDNINTLRMDLNFEENQKGIYLIQIKIEGQEKPFFKKIILQ
jgi:hypothetical protein